MSYRLPPLNGAHTFEAAARHFSFKHAAGGPGVTPGAASQQVRALGQALFCRLRRNLLLTREARLAKRTGFAVSRKPEHGRLVHLKDLPRNAPPE
jgi:LysR family glycine cleavage system transcriptional activator